MGYINVKIAGGNRFLENSKEPKEGFYTNNWEFGDKTGTNYKREHKVIKGTLNRIALTETPFTPNIELLNISVKYGEDIYSLDIELNSKNGDCLNDWVTSLGPFYENLVPGMDFELNLNTTSMQESKDGKKYPNKWAYIKSNGVALAQSYTRDDCPKWEKLETTNRSGNVTKKLDKTKADDFVFERLKATVLRFEEERNGSTATNTSSQAPTTAVKTVQAVVIEDVDDGELPF